MKTAQQLRDFLPISRYISQTIQDTAMVAMEGEEELIRDLPNGAIANPNPVFKIRPFFDAEYLQNDCRYGQSYYGRRIGNCTQAFEWHQFQ